MIACSRCRSRIPMLRAHCSVPVRLPWPYAQTTPLKRAPRGHHSRRWPPQGAAPTSHLERAVRDAHQQMAGELGRSGAAQLPHPTRFHHAAALMSRAAAAASSDRIMNGFRTSAASSCTAPIAVPALRNCGGTGRIGSPFGGPAVACSPGTVGSCVCVGARACCLLRPSVITRVSPVRRLGG